MEAARFIKITLNMEEDTNVYGRYAYQKVRHKNLNSFTYFMPNLITIYFKAICTYNLFVIIS